MVVGTGFAPGCTLTVNGEERAAQSRSPTELVLTLTADDLARIEAGGDFHIAVKNREGLVSEAFDFA